MANITMIPAKKTMFTSAGQATNPLGKRRTAGYARVSTDKEEQENSFDAQVRYYTNYIMERPDWEFISVYTDDGISATSTAKRDGFNSMVVDALDGKFDLIVTKSVSRFARNTVDSLSTIRKLKEKGVEVFFEKEQIWTFDGKGELLITIMSSLAQEESRSISENTTWGQRRRMQEGRVSMAFGRFLGYEKGEDGKPAINENEAQTVRLIYKLFIEGKTPSAIGRYLTNHGVPTPGSKEQWQTSVIISILENEKYAGNALLQKGYTTNFLTKSRKKNEGEIPQFFVEDSHPAIISVDEWEAVQAEMNRRKAIGRPVGCNSPFAARLVCGFCNGYYGPKTWGSYKDSKTYRRVVWQCNDKYTRPGKLGKGCKTPTLNEDDIKTRFMAAWNEMAGNKDTLITDCKAAKTLICECKTIHAELEELEREVEVVTELSRKAISDNARTAQNQIDFNERNNGYLERLQLAHGRIDELENEKRRRKHTARVLGTFIRNLESSPQTLDAFDDKVWTTSIDRVTVREDGKLIFRFMNGTEVEG